MVASLSPSENNLLFRQFSALAERYRDYVQSTGIPVVAYRSSDLQHFSKCSDFEKRKIIEALECAVEICEAAAAADKAFTPRMLLWHALKKLGLRPTSDLFNYVGDDSIIEIHSRDGVQIFRNFNFYKFCSYSIEEMFCGSWDSLYKRDPLFIELIMKYVRKIYSGDVMNTIPTDTPPHVVEEIGSHRKYAVEINITHVSPLFSGKNEIPEATIVIETAKLAKAPRFTSPGLELAF